MTDDEEAVTGKAATPNSVTGRDELDPVDIGATDAVEVTERYEWS